MKKVVRRSWYALPMPATVITRMNALVQGQPNDPDFLDCNNFPLWELDTTGVDAGGTEAQHIELIELETDIDPIPAGAETLQELVER